MVYSPGQVLTLERISARSRTFPTGYGSDTGGGNTLGMLQHLRRRFGPVASFTASYRADSWTLQISRQNSSGMFVSDCVECDIYSLNGILFDAQAVHHQL